MSRSPGACSRRRRVSIYRGSRSAAASATRRSCAWRFAMKRVFPPGPTGVECTVFISRTIDPFPWCAKTRPHAASETGIDAQGEPPPSPRSRSEAGQEPGLPADVHGQYRACQAAPGPRAAPARAPPVGPACIKCYRPRRGGSRRTYDRQPATPPRSEVEAEATRAGRSARKEVGWPQPDLELELLVMV
jgi:hypothetical protein